MPSTMGLGPALAAAIGMSIFWAHPLTDQCFREIGPPSPWGRSRPTSSKE